MPNEKDLLDNLGKIAYTLDKAFIPRLAEDYAVVYFDEKYNKEGNIDFVNNIRVLKIERWIFDKDENPGECFKNVLSLFSDGDHSIALVVERTPISCNMYLVVKNEGAGRNEDSKNNIELLNSSIKGNFPGTCTSILEDVGEVETLLSFPKAKSIAVLENTPSEFSKDYVTQGFDKLLNGIVPATDEESYVVILLAESLTQDNIREIVSGFEDMATAIYPFMGYQFQIGKNETNTKGEMKSISNTESISNSVFKTHSINIGINGSIGTSRSKSKTVSGSVGAVIKGIVNVGVGVAKTLTNTISGSVGASAGYGYSWGNSKTVSNGKTDTAGTSSSISVGKSENTSYNYKSFMVAGILEKLEDTIKRINESQATGLWKYATYVIANDSRTSKNVANYMRAVTQGKDSYIEKSAIQEWSETSGNGASAFSEIMKYVMHLTHPVFVSSSKEEKDLMLVTATAYVGTDKLSNVVVFPRKSVQGLPVVECARFGREPHSLISLKKDIDLGCSYHMHTSEKQNRVFLSKDELTKHTFITGSTGSGKSNTIFKLIEQLCPVNSNGTHFLVIEPAKGEYKDVFGERDDVTVYGTNPFKVPNLLQINPFSFPNDVHVLEHIDRLVEVFNACWPMYAAMPAILKESVEKAYEECGWNLRTSKNPGRFPTFSDLLMILPNVVDSSEYSSDTSSDYKGALVTRIRSLTRGIHGQIFSEEILLNEIFNKNVIIDISRIGSSETKSLIMGILILKLQEFRMSESVGHNCGLRHVTVLEEAHNLLRKTSSEQSQESSNLQGKSVEMLANAIAEMRTYGEGFIIADQSPGLMDMSVIRNTNTKIIMRLLDESDRRLVGKAAGLTDSQVDELSRLEQGVAAISQSDWLEPVLCKIDKFEYDISLKKHYSIDSFKWIDDDNVAIQQFLSAAFDAEHKKLTKDVIDKIRKWYGELKLSPKSLDIFENVLENNNIDDKQKMLLIYYVVGKKLKSIVKREDAISEIKHTLIGKYSFDENSEVIQRINELFLLYFPLNTILDNTTKQVERFGREVK